MNMKKSELVKAIAENLSATEKSVKEMLDSLDSVVVDALTSGKQVDLGFGKLQTSVRKARDGVNPQTREKIRIAASTVVKFKAAKKLKESVNTDA